LTFAEVREVGADFIKPLDMMSEISPSRILMSLHTSRRKMFMEYWQPPPCTEFSVLNCKAEARERKPEEGLKIVLACMRIIQQSNPKWWAMENPVGYLREYMGKPTTTFQPWQYGDPWTKRTDLWGSFSVPEKKYKNWEDVPEKLDLYTRPGRSKPNFAYLHKSAHSLIPQLSFCNPKTDAEFRAITPPSFSKAFFEANQ